MLAFGGVQAATSQDIPYQHLPVRVFAEQTVVDGGGFNQTTLNWAALANNGTLGITGYTTPRVDTVVISRDGWLAVSIVDDAAASVLHTVLRRNPATGTWVDLGIPTDAEAVAAYATDKDAGLSISPGGWVNLTYWGGTPNTSRLYGPAASAWTTPQADGNPLIINSFDQSQASPLAIGWSWTGDFASQLEANTIVVSTYTYDPVTLTATSLATSLPYNSTTYPRGVTGDYIRGSHVTGSVIASVSPGFIAPPFTGTIGTPADFNVPTFPTPTAVTGADWSQIGIADDNNWYVRAINADGVLFDVRDATHNFSAAAYRAHGSTAAPTLIVPPFPINDVNFRDGIDLADGGFFVYANQRDGAGNYFSGFQAKWTPAGGFVNLDQGNVFTSQRSHLPDGGALDGAWFTSGFRYVSNGTQIDQSPTVWIPTPLVSLAPISATATENGSNASIRLSRTGSLLFALNVKFSLSSTTDLVPVGQTALGGGLYRAVIPRGATTVDVALVALDDTLVEANETVVVSLEDGLDNNAANNNRSSGRDAYDHAAISGNITVISDDIATNPQPVLSRNGSGATKDPLTITITFNEAVVNVASGDLTASTGALGAITGSGTTYTATWTPPAGGAGTVTLSVAAGIANASDDNASSLAATDLVISYDTQAPTVSAPVLAGGSDSGTPGDGITNDNTPTVNGTAEANATVRIWDGPTAGVELGSTVADPSGNWTITSAILADGGNGLYAEATDALGNVSARVGPLGLQIDTQAPNLTLSIVPTTPTSQVASNWGGSVDAGSTVSVSRQNLATTTTTANVTDTTWSATVTLGTGTNQVTVTAIDDAGNQTVSSTYAIFLNDGSPAVTFVERFYTLVLQRTADAGGLAYWVDSLRAGTLDGASLARGFVLSPEFIARNLDDAQFVEIMYQAFFDRASDAGGLTYWTGQLVAGVLREDVLWGFIGSTEFSTLSTNAGITAISPANQQLRNVRSFVRRFYQQCLQREGDAGGIAYWTQSLIDGSLTGASLARNFFLSSEFIARGLSDSAYVDILYSTFFSRAADDGGRTYWLNQIAGGSTRSEVLDSFIYSQEFSDLCTAYGINPFGASG
ncbi:hypothetical protein LBMAG53_31610 [Planctomycetota bacterium]|nr:hypothetical protein LBMAG53_31610 [Planctomycetota bacterium]